MKQLSDDEYKAFLKDLTCLSKKHGIQIGGCGCCGSPHLSPIDKKELNGSYFTSEANDSLQWDASDE